MTYDAGSVTLPARGYVYFAVGTAVSVPAVKPTVPANPATNPTVPTGWVAVGSTSADSPLTIARDQDDPTSLPTWAAPGGIRNSTPAVAWSIQFSVLENSQLAFDLYFGAGGTSAAGSYAVTTASSGAPSYGALYFHIIDTAHTGGAVGLYIPKVSITGSDNLEMATDALNTMPVTARVLDATGTLFSWVDTAIT